MADLADIFINESTLGFVGVQVHFARPDASAPVEILGSLAFVGDVAIYRPAPPTPPPPSTPSGPYIYAGAASSSAPGAGGGTFALAPSPTALPGFVAGATKVGPAFSRLWAMRKSPEAYPLYEAIDALIEAVLELNRRGGGL